jgi:general secretion pathway protein K
VLWTLFILGALAIAINSYVWPQLNFAGKFRDRTKALYAAKAGAKAVIAQVVQDKDKSFDSLKDPWYSAETFRDVPIGDSFLGVSVKDEERKININKAPQAVLKGIFAVSADLSADDPVLAEISASIIDWRDADDKQLENGAETGYYAGLKPAYPCKNADFQVLDELLQVRGMTQQIFDASKEYLTVYGIGAVNINTCGTQVLRGLGASEDLAKKIAAYRKGLDGEEGTEDDKVFDSVSGVVTALSKSGGFSSQELSQAAALVAAGSMTVRSDNFTGRSDGESGNKTYGITFTFNRNDVIKRWRSD